MKLSIVIPVYNAENTLRRCIDSVISQSYRDWQMILVDDASTDKSAAICDEYGQGNGHITVIHHKSNQGLSAARNTGIAKAKGEYITFIDSDDYIAEDTLKQLMEIIAIHPDYDILEYPIYEHFGSKNQHMLRFYKKEYSSMKEYWLEGNAYKHTYACNKVFRRDLFYGMEFPPGKNFEDVWTLPKLLRKCSLVATTDVGLYYYCDNPNGITRQASLEDLESLYNANLEVLKELQPTPRKKQFDEKLNNYFSHYYASVLNILLDVTDRSGKVSDFPILPYKNTVKLKLLHILGLKLLCKLHRIYHNSH